MRYFSLFFTFLFFFILSCNEKRQSLSCPPSVVSVFGRAEENLFIRGSFNNWQNDTPMEFKDGKWSVQLFLKPGNYAYEFYNATEKTHFNDSENPLTIFDKNIRFSRLIVKDCRFPTLEMKKRPVIKDKNISFNLYFHSSQNSFPDLKNSKILLNGKPFSPEFDETNKVFKINFKAKTFGKYSFLFVVKDKNGFASEPFFVPLWIEKNKFNWKNAVIYQIMTDRFFDGDKTNDNRLESVDKKANWQGGDFEGIIKKIEENYFQKLGVNVLWISSPIINTQKKWHGMGGDKRFYSAYHSYWPIGTGESEFFKIPKLKTAIEPHFGSEKKLKELMQKAHLHGLRVIFDFVPNHVHTDSFMWQTYKNDGWFHLASSDEKPNKNGGYTCGWEKPVDCWFTDYLADINYKSIEATDFVINHLLWLVENFDADGLRIDAVRLMEEDFVSTLKTFVQRKIQTTGEPFYMVGETFTNETGWDEIGKYLGEKKLDGQFDFPLFYQISKTFLLETETFEKLDKFLKENKNHYKKYYENSLMSIFFGNHDICRAISVANGDFDLTPLGGNKANEKVWENSPQIPKTKNPFEKLQNAQTFLMTQNGIPSIFQGDEFGMPGANDPDNRRMMIFDDDLNKFQKQTLEHFQKLGNLRKKHIALSTGEMKTIDISDNFWAYSKIAKEDKLIVFFTTNNQEQEIKISCDNIFENNQKLTELFSNQTLFCKNGFISFKLKNQTSGIIF